MEKSIYSFLTAFTLKFFPILKGNFSTGKWTTISEVCRMLAQNLIVRPITPMIRKLPIGPRSRLVV